MNDLIPNFKIPKVNKNKPAIYYCSYCNAILVGGKESPDRVKIIRCQNGGCMKMSLTLKKNKPILIKHLSRHNFYLVWQSNSIFSVGTIDSNFCEKIITSASCEAEIGSDVWHQTLNKVNSDSIKRIEKLKIFK